MLQASKPQLRAWIDQVGEIYSKAVIAATAIALLVLPLAGVPLLSTATQRGCSLQPIATLLPHYVVLLHDSCFQRHLHRRCSLRR